MSDPLSAEAAPAGPSALGQLPPDLLAKLAWAFSTYGYFPPPVWEQVRACPHPWIHEGLHAAGGLAAAVPCAVPGSAPLSLSPSGAPCARCAWAAAGGAAVASALEAAGTSCLTIEGGPPGTGTGTGSPAAQLGHMLLSTPAHCPRVLARVPQAYLQDGIWQPGMGCEGATAVLWSLGCMQLPAEPLWLRGYYVQVRGAVLMQYTTLCCTTSTTYLRPDVLDVERSVQAARTSRTGGGALGFRV